MLWGEICPILNMQIQPDKVRALTRERQDILNMILGLVPLVEVEDDCREGGAMQLDKSIEILAFVFHNPVMINNFPKIRPAVDAISAGWVIPAIPNIAFPAGRRCEQRQRR